MKEIILALVISGLSSVLDQFARNENEKADIGVNPDVRFLVKANNSIRFYTQHRFRCSLTVLTDKTKVLYSSFSPVATVEGAITDGLCQVVRLYMFAAFQVGNGACYLQDAVVGAGR